MIINFTKMHGLGNDFMVVDMTNSPEMLISTQQIESLADRHYGVGFDQMLVVENSEVADFRYRIINADGSEVAQCGNGARCFARFVTEKGLTSNNPISVETRNGVMRLLINEDNTVRVDMGEPQFEPVKIPLEIESQATVYKVNGIEFGALSIGNPHCILIVDKVENTEVEAVASAIQESQLFPEGVNVGFMQIVDRGVVLLRVYERGAGETLACGSGACAAIIHGIKLGLLDQQVTVNFKGGSVIVEYTPGEHVFLMGPAEFIYEGQVEI
ncbi:diaminopimelate epimerase [Bathymodiolus septemdierum thioautotrophic gill symbiont]|uniref:Diaminopimelate epimerase n=1 Tax=endosymbiont of Bathymodiolus septemdierum str. Myojin knoll TaxID=1303921 RepID=A0A0P0USE4_9GAMM|nr:diaminopimelate epimerase [Bathymodiolus septemdierum thioautotrophic gill symbiont]BAS67889.1 diaminopimelate epimerase [endosymbiont of Bathymodiolus septemdierum str. Myojin knoll]